MTKLSDIQLVLLSTASAREDGSLLPPPESLGAPATRIRRAITQLMTRVFAAEFEISDRARVWRTEGEQKLGVMITDAGRAAIGIGESKMERPEAAQPAAPADVSAAATPRPGSKQALVVDLLKRDGGASLAELVEATAWLPHTTRAALTGLRKRGLAVTSEKVEGTTRYQIVAAV